MYINSKYIGALVSCVILLLTGVPGAYAQQASGVSGIVVEKGGSARLSDVNVTNLRTKKRVQTNTFGVFIIEESVGDSLSLIKSGYQQVKTIFLLLVYILVEMLPGLTIEDVVVSRMIKVVEMRDMLDIYSKKRV